MVKRALTLLTSILIALPLLMPFNIYANATHQVQIDYLSTVSSEWTNSMVFTSYCEGTNASTASCVLTVNITKSPKNYFGTVTIHGYDSSGTKWINYGDIFVSAGTGVYNYNFYQNGIKEISRVEVYSTNLIQPSSNVDLSQIISLLTSINNYENRNNLLLDVIDDNTLNTVNEIKNVISQLIVSNGYLETISKLRQYNFPIESLPYVSFMATYDVVDYFIVNSNYSYPVFNLKTDYELYRAWSNPNYYHMLIFWVNNNIYNLDIFNRYFTINKNVTFDYFQRIGNGFQYNGQQYYLIKCIFQYKEINADTLTIKSLNDNIYCIPIFYYYGANKINSFNISSDFALQYGLSNNLLDDLHLIANGTTASQSAADSSQSANEQLQTDSNTLFQQENGFKSDMNNAMQNVNTTFRLQDMGIKFVSSAQWVRSQYESLTNNTPFASLITFSLITGLALILLGKVYK